MTGQDFMLTGAQRVQQILSDAGLKTTLEPPTSGTEPARPGQLDGGRSAAQDLLGAPADVGDLNAHFTHYGGISAFGYTASGDGRTTGSRRVPLEHRHREGHRISSASSSSRWAATPGLSVPDDQVGCSADADVQHRSAPRHRPGHGAAAGRAGRQHRLRLRRHRDDRRHRGAHRRPSPTRRRRRRARRRRPATAGPASRSAWRSPRPSASTSARSRPSPPTTRSRASSSRCTACRSTGSPARRTRPSPGSQRTAPTTRRAPAWTWARALGSPSRSRRTQLTAIVHAARRPTNHGSTKAYTVPLAHFTARHQPRGRSHGGRRLPGDGRPAHPAQGRGRPRAQGTPIP